MHNIDENEVLRDALSGLNEEVPPMPEDLHAEWMQQIEDQHEFVCHQTQATYRRVTRFLSVAAAMVFVIGGTLLTRDNLSADQMAYQASYVENGSMKRSVAQADMAYGAYTAGAGVEEAADNGVMLTMARGADTSTPAAAPVEKKIIRTAGMTIKTQAYDEALAALESACTGQGGWIESSSESTNTYSGMRTAWLTLRIPQEALDSFLDGTEGLGRVTSRNASAEDVTATYQDTQTRLNTQLALMERLQALITESGDLSDLLALESQIAETQYQIDTLQTALNHTDRQVSYATVNITLQEEKVAELTDTTVSFGDRIVSAIQVGLESLVGFLGDMVVFLVAALPFIAIAAVVVIAVRLIIKRRKK